MKINKQKLHELIMDVLLIRNIPIIYIVYSYYHLMVFDNDHLKVVNHILVIICISKDGTLCMGEIPTNRVYAKINK